MTCLEILEVIADGAAILTAIFAAGATVYFWRDARKKRLKVEEYLKGEKAKAAGPPKGQHTYPASDGTARPHRSRNPTSILFEASISSDHLPRMKRQVGPKPCFSNTSTVRQTRTLPIDLPRRRGGEAPLAPASVKVEMWERLLRPAQNNAATRKAYIAATKAMNGEMSIATPNAWRLPSLFPVTILVTHAATSAIPPPMRIEAANMPPTTRTACAHQGRGSALAANQLK